MVKYVEITNHDEIHNCQLEKNMYAIDEDNDNELRLRTHVVDEGLENFVSVV